jgi:hypothetical protein
VLVSLSIQRAKKLYKIMLLFLRQFEWKDQRILVWILHSALVVKVYDILEGLEAAVMHIGGGTGDLPQSRSLKCAEFFRVLGDHIPTEIHFVVVPADAKVVKLFVGEVEPRMALRAAGFVSEQEEAALGLW